MRSALRRLSGGLVLAAWALAACGHEAPVVVPAGRLPTPQTQAPASPQTLVTTAPRASPATGEESRITGTPLSQPPNRAATATFPPTETASPETMPASTTAPSTPTSNPALLGTSTGGWPIEVYSFGSGPRRLALIGGIHGGYEWNTILLAYQIIDYFTAHPEAVPDGLRLDIIPSANPDGQALVTGRAGRFTEKEVGPDPEAGRFNQNQVDLNRNWDCNWKPTGVWRQREVSAGKEPFSEVETQLVKDFLTQTPVEAVVFWHSAAGAVYPGECGERSALSDELARLYAEAAGYAYQPEFDSYAVDGDATNWLAQQGIPSLAVELSNHDDTEWEQNLKGVQSLLETLAGQDLSFSTGD